MLSWVVVAPALPASRTHTQRSIVYRLDQVLPRESSGYQPFSDTQLGVLEKLNRVDRDHLHRLTTVVIPDVWLDDELAYATLPATYASSASMPKLLVLHIPGQLFGAYEFGTLVRWGPISSGRRTSQTPAGRFHLTWRSTGRVSTVDPDWFMRWYFNFENEQGLSLHEYSLPGSPASHGCVRLLTRDAQWLFGWGETWSLDASGSRVLRAGTPMLIVGAYDFDAPPPWRSLEWLAGRIELPAVSADDWVAENSSAARR